MGEVLDSVFDPARQRVVGLVVREKVLGAVPGLKSELPADRIAAAVPGREAFVLDGADSAEPREPKPRRIAPAARVAGNGAASAAKVASNGAATAAKAASNGATTAAKAAGTGAAGAARVAGTGAAGAARRVAVVGVWLAAMWHVALPVLRAIATTIVTWIVGFAGWLVAAARALAAEARREVGELRRRRSLPRQ